MIILKSSQTDAWLPTLTSFLFRRLTAPFLIDEFLRKGLLMRKPMCALAPECIGCVSLCVHLCTQSLDCVSLYVHMKDVSSCKINYKYFIKKFSWPLFFNSTGSAKIRFNLSLLMAPWSLAIGHAASFINHSESAMHMSNITM